MVATKSRTAVIAAAVSTAQRLANDERRAYLVAPGHPSEEPMITHLPGLEPLGSYLVSCVDAGRLLIVSPQGMYPGLSAAEIVAESQSQ